MATARLPLRLHFSDEEFSLSEDATTGGAEEDAETAAAPEPWGGPRPLVIIRRGDITKWAAEPTDERDDEDDFDANKDETSSSSSSSSSGGGEGEGSSAVTSTSTSTSSPSPSPSPSRKRKRKRGPVAAVVNAANERCLGGGGVDGAIHRAAGRALREHCAAQLPLLAPRVRCFTGGAVVTPAFAMSDRVDRIVHTVGPIFNEATPKKCRRLLYSAYQASLDLAETEGVTQLAFPALSCGIFGYPLESAAHTAYDAIAAHFRRHWPVAAATTTAAAAAAAGGNADPATTDGEAATTTGGTTPPPKKIKKSRSTAARPQALQAVTFVMFEKETADVWRRVAEARGMSLASS